MGVVKYQGQSKMIPKIDSNQCRELEKGGQCDLHLLWGHAFPYLVRGLKPHYSCIDIEDVFVRTLHPPVQDHPVNGTRTTMTVDHPAPSHV